MLNSFYKYLILHDHAGIPGIGNFSVERSAASIDGNDIHPPLQAIVFAPGSALTDKQFYRFLSDETGLSEVDSVRKFQDFAYQLRKDIQSYPCISLKGLGILKRNATGDIAFEPVAGAGKYFSPVTLPAVSDKRKIIHREEESDVNGIEVYPEAEMVKKDRWWIWALALALMALAVIGYFIMQGDIL
jgi:hypothetical protein